MSLIEPILLLDNHPKLIGASCQKTEKESAKVETIDGSEWSDYRQVFPISPVIDVMLLVR